jgi:hypothetical protein
MALHWLELVLCVQHTEVGNTSKAFGRVLPGRRRFLAVIYVRDALELGM